MESNVKSKYVQQPIIISQGLKTNLQGQLLVEMDKSSLDQLIKSHKVKVLKRLDQSHSIIKMLDDDLSILSEAKYVAEANNDWKVSVKVLKNEIKSFSNKRFSVVGLSPNSLMVYLNDSGITNLKQVYYYNNNVVIETNDPRILEVLKSNQVITHIDLVNTTLLEETSISTHDLTINRINRLHSENPELNGASRTVSVKEDLYNGEDIDLIGRQKSSGLESEFNSEHATEMATIIGGAGNSFINGKGVAFGVHFTSSSFENILPDPDDSYTDLNISVQNHSYGTSVTDNVYGVEAKAFDENTRNHPQLLHVFSAGNIGRQVTSEGIYAGVEGYANLSGNFKMAKNVLLVGAIDENGLVDNRNSAGPAYDGRLKPELVAYGKSGTSESAALVSGVSLLLQEHYYNQHSTLPNASLVKAALIAGAEDVGEEGIDFRTGYGNLNAVKSMAVLQNEQYFENKIGQSSIMEYNLSLPAAVRQLKLALTWTDINANTEDDIALVNDLDMKLTNVGTNNSWLPWVLDHSPDADLLSLPAMRNYDHLNNVEFITIDFPEEGDYLISIEGYNVFTESQTFSLVYDWEYVNEFEWTYPSKNDILNSDEVNVFRWDTNTTDVSDIEIQIDNGAWNTIINQVDLATGNVEWTSENISSKAKLRVSVNGQYIESDEFIIAPLIVHSVGFNCDDAFMLQWNKLEGVENYNVYGLGNKYMEFIENTTDTLAVLDKIKYPEANYAISPVWQGVEGNKSLAFSYLNQGVNCYYKNFLVRNEDNVFVNIELNISATYNVKELVIQRRKENEDYQYLTTLQPSANKLNYTFNDFKPFSDFSFYRAIIVLNNGEYIELEEVEVFFPDERTLEIFPNPIEQNDFFTLLAKGDGGILEMVDLTGTIVRQWEINSDVADYELPNVLKGIYILQLKRGSTVFGRSRLMVY